MGGGETGREVSVMKVRQVIETQRGEEKETARDICLRLCHHRDSFHDHTHSDSIIFYLNGT